jgi:hypothetical protein
MQRFFGGFSGDYRAKGWFLVLGGCFLAGRKKKVALLGLV